MRCVRINPSWYPAIILGTFTLFLVLGLAIGFRPGHGDAERRGGGRSMLEPQIVRVVLA